MSPEFSYLLGTICFWGGGISLLCAFYFGIRLRLAQLDGQQKAFQFEVQKFGVLGVVLLLLTRILPMDLGRSIEGKGFQVPVVWVYTPFWGWILVLGAVLGINSLVQMAMGISLAERKTKAISAVVWLILAIISLFFFNKYNQQYTIFRGAWRVAPMHMMIAILIVVASVVFIGYSNRRSNSRSFGKAFWTHSALILGCFLFGLPFLWLLSSSLKEDKDLTGGVVWIPKVTQKVEYFDPVEPQYSGNFEGIAVTATLIEKLPGGVLKLDVLRPMSMRGRTFEARESELKLTPSMIPMVQGTLKGAPFTGKVIKDLPNGDKMVELISPIALAGTKQVFTQDEAQEIRPNGLRWENYPDALQYLPPETQMGWVYLKNTLLLVFLSLIGTILSCSIVAYAFSRLKFPGKEFLFTVVLSTMMLPGAVTLMPQFLIFKSLGWVDTLLPLWVPSFFAGAFNIYLLRQFFNQIPMELEDAARIDGCSYLRTYWSVMMPQIKPAIAVIAIWTFMGTWNNFMGPLIYINSPENMPVAYALQLFNGERGGEPGLLMAFATITMLPVLIVFFFAQKYFIEGVSLSGLGGR